MGKNQIMSLGYAVALLFLIQAITTLVSSVYITQLLGLGMNAKAAAILFMLAPILLLAMSRRSAGAAMWAVCVVLIVARGILPFLGTSGRLLTSGIATAAALILVSLMLSRQPQVTGQVGLPLGLGLALAVGASVLLRTLGASLDVSLDSRYAWLAWALGALLIACLPTFDAAAAPSLARAPGAFWPSLGLVMALTLVYFAFSAPAVIARWTGVNGAIIISAVSLLWLGWAALLTWRPALADSLGLGWLGGWNALFAVALIGTILANTVSFPATPESPPVVAAGAAIIPRILLALMLISSPVVLLDALALARPLIGADPKRLAPGLAVGMFLMLLLIFAGIFSNTWGYIKPVSPFFRGKFWLPFLIAVVAMAVTALASWRTPPPLLVLSTGTRVWRAAYSLLLVALLVPTAWAAWRSGAAVRPGTGGQQLTLMTYNIQQGVGPDGELAYMEQLGLMRLVNADVITLQESDSARISLGNVDLAGYYAYHLGYHCYYGPKTVTGTYGTAILSRYPLENTRAIFTYSDKDEDGAAYAEVVVGSQRFHIYNLHPDGSMAAKVACVQPPIDRVQNQGRVLALGDYNARPGYPSYDAMAAAFQDAWYAVYPSGTDSSNPGIQGSAQIDHIFVSPDLRVLSATYLPSPQSASDHPAHWATVGW